MNWLAGAVIPRLSGPVFDSRRSGHYGRGALAIVGARTESRTPAIYELAWHLGASQSDLAFLEATSGLANKVISFNRRKTGQFVAGALWRGGRAILNTVAGQRSFLSLSAPGARGVAPPNSNNVASGWHYRRQFAFLSLCLGERRAGAGIRSGLRKRRSATTARQCIALTPNAPKSSCRRWRLMSNRLLGGSILPMPRSILLRRTSRQSTAPQS